MKISKQIEQLQAFMAEHGDLETMMEENGSMYTLDSMDVEIVEDDDCYPTDWKMPKGFTFVRLQSFA